MEKIDSKNSRNSYIDLHYNKKSSFFPINKMKILSKYLLFIFISIFFIGIIIFIIINFSKGQKLKVATLQEKEAFCEKGYYMTLDDKTCQKCSIENCKECYGTKLSNICTSCDKKYEPIYINNSINSCQIKSSINCLNYDMYNNICLKCNNGYYLVDDEENKTICKKCSIENCKECYGDKNSNECTSCNDNYVTIYSNNNIINSCELPCETGENEKCLICDKIKNKCSKCNDGYYLPEDDENKKVCQKCSIENCKECYGTKNSNLCTLCYENYVSIYSNNNIINSCELPCETGENEKCLICDKIKNKCSKCNDGYYLPEDDENKKVCQKCSIENCKECYGTKNSNLCSLCNQYLTTIYENNIIKNCKYTCEEGEDAKCLTCDKIKNQCSSCNIGYELINGECKLIDSIKGIYKTNSMFETVNIINYPLYKIKKMVIDNKNIEPCTNYTFTSQGYHEVYLLVNISTEDDSLANMFENITNLNSIYFDYSFNTTNIKDMSNMFYGCNSLSTINISVFDTINVEKIVSMFYGCSSLIYIDLSNFNINNIKDMSSLFYGCSSLISFNLNNFNSNKVYNMSSMFYECYLIKSIDLSSFDTSEVHDMSSMFYGCSSLSSINLTNFNTKKVNNMSSMFYNCSLIKSIDLSSFDTSYVYDMSSMFYGCSSLTSINLTNFNFLNVKYMHFMFFSCSGLIDVDFSNFNTLNLETIHYMFWGCSSLKKIDLSNLNTEKVHYMNSVFYGCSSLASIDLSHFNVINVEDMNSMFCGCSSLKSINLSYFNTPNIKYMNYTFYNCSSLTSINLSNFNPNNLAEINSMFYGCTSLTSIDIKKFNTKKVKDMNSLFYDCSSLKSLDLSNFNTDNTLYMNHMFYNCSSLTSIILSNFNLSNVISTDSMFYKCSNLISIQFSNIKLNNIDNMNYTFYECNSLTSIGLINIETNNLINMGYIFYNCYSLKSIAFSNNIINTNNINYMFYNCSSLTSIDLSSFHTSQIDYTANYYEVHGIKFYYLVYAFEKVFYFCSNLEYLDISSLEIIEATSVDFFNDCLPDSGTIKISLNYSNKIQSEIPNDWKVIYN